MSKRKNMGRKSHMAQDAHYDQNIVGLDQEIGDQQTRPYVGKQQATKSSKDNPASTK